VVVFFVWAGELFIQNRLYFCFLTSIRGRKAYPMLPVGAHWPYLLSLLSNTHDMTAAVKSKKNFRQEIIGRQGRRESIPL
jgi:hypothetical protein